MEVTLRIKNIEMSQNVDTIEFVYKNSCSVIKDVVIFSIVTLHDLLFEKVTFRLKSRGAIWDKYTGVVNINNSSFIKRSLKDNIEPVLSSEYVFKTEFYDFGGLQTIGKMTYDFTINQIYEGLNGVEEQDTLVQKIFTLFLDQQQSVLIKNFQTVLDEFLMGSRGCKINFILGLYIMEKYTANIYYEMTKNLKFENIKNLKKLEIFDKTNMFYLGSFVNEKVQKLTSSDFLKKNDFEIEKYLLGSDKNFKYSKITDFTNYTPSRTKSSSDSNKEHKSKTKEELSNLYKKFNEFYKKKFNNREVLDLLESCMTEMVEEDYFSKRIEDTSDEDFYMLQDLEKLFQAPKDYKPIKEHLSNDEYIIAHKDFLTQFVNCFYFALGSYGNTWPTIFCARRKKVKNSKMDANRKAILEFLNIENEFLISIQMADKNIPEHIIFYDKEYNRLVVSFKGTSTSEEALKDLNCRYTKFYDGFAHKGIKHMACEFVKYKTKILLDLLETYKTKNILFTGHSLGASIAILVHLIYIKQGISEFLNIVTMAFCAAPVVSFNIASQKYKNLFVITYGNDFIARLNYGSFIEMKYIACSLGNKSGVFGKIENIEDDLKKIKVHNKCNNKYPKLFCPGINYHFKRVIVIKQNKKISLILYKKVNLDFFESMIVIKHATIHHMLPHILYVCDQGIKDSDEIDNK